VAIGNQSHAEGLMTIAKAQGEHAGGMFNESHSGICSIGIGSDGDRKNAFEIMRNGDTYLYDVGGYQGTNTKV